MSIIVICINASIQAQNYFQYTPPKYVSSFVPLDLNVINRSLENKQKQSDNNIQYYKSLLNYAKDLKSKQTDEQFAKGMGICVDYLENDIYEINHGDFSDSRTSTMLTNVKDRINEEIDAYNERNAKKNDPITYWHKGMEYYGVGDFSNAMTQFKIVQSLAPDFRDVYPVLAYSQFKLHDYMSALDNFNKAAETNSDKEIYRDRGWTKYYLYDFTGAMADFTQQIAIDPSNPEAYYNRGSAKSELKDYYGAINDYKKAIELKPSFSMAYNNLGWAKFEQKKFTEALKYLDIAIDKEPKNYVAWDSRAETKFNLGDLRGCISDCNQALILYDKLANSYFIRGRAKYKLGKNEEACIDWSDAGQYGKQEAYDFIAKYCK